MPDDQEFRSALAGLAAQGFGAVIYLAPPTVPDAIAGEAETVRRQGLEFINIPIRFGNPTEADFRSFVAATARLRDRKVLVHCQVNMRSLPDEAARSVAGRPASPVAEGRRSRGCRRPSPGA